MHGSQQYGSSRDMKAAVWLLQRVCIFLGIVATPVGGFSTYSLTRNGGGGVQPYARTNVRESSRFKLFIRVNGSTNSNEVFSLSNGSLPRRSVNDALREYATAQRAVSEELFLPENIELRSASYVSEPSSGAPFWPEDDDEESPFGGGSTPNLEVYSVKMSRQVQSEQVNVVREELERKRISRISRRSDKDPRKMGDELDKSKEIPGGVTSGEPVGRNGAKQSSVPQNRLVSRRELRSFSVSDDVDWANSQSNKAALNKFDQVLMAASRPDASPLDKLIASALNQTVSDSATPNVGMEQGMLGFGVDAQTPIVMQVQQDYTYSKANNKRRITQLVKPFSKLLTLDFWVYTASVLLLAAIAKGVSASYSNQSLL